MTAIVSDMSHVYEEEYARLGRRRGSGRARTQNAVMRAYAAGRGWETAIGNDDFIHDEEKFREALRYALEHGIFREDEEPAP